MTTSCSVHSVGVVQHYDFLRILVLNVSLKMATLNILLIITAVTSSVLKSSARHWLIVPEGSSSDCQPYTTRICSTLTQLSSQLNGTGDITLTFLPGYHLLTWNLSLCDADNVTFNSKQLGAITAQELSACIKKKSSPLQGLNSSQSKD